MGTYIERTNLTRSMFKTYYDALTVYARTHLNRGDLVEEAVLETYVRFWKSKNANQTVFLFTTIQSLVIRWNSIYSNVHQRKKQVQGHVLEA